MAGFIICCCCLPYLLFTLLAGKGKKTGATTGTYGATYVKDTTSSVDV